MCFCDFCYTQVGVKRKKNLSPHLLKAIKCAHALPWPWARLPGSPPLDVVTFVGESMPGVCLDVMFRLAKHGVFQVGTLRLICGTLGSWARELGAPPLDLDSFAGESVRGVCSDAMF